MHAQAARRNNPLGRPAILEHEAFRRVRLLTILLGPLSLSSLTTHLEPSARYSWPGWFPSVDGKTLTDYPLRLLNAGKIAKVPVMSELLGMAHQCRLSQVY